MALFSLDSRALPDQTPSFIQWSGRWAKSTRPSWSSSNRRTLSAGHRAPTSPSTTLILTTLYCPSIYGETLSLNGNFIAPSSSHQIWSEGTTSCELEIEMMDIWWSLLGVAVSAFVTGQAVRVKRRHARATSQECTRTWGAQMRSSFVREFAILIGDQIPLRDHKNEKIIYHKMNTRIKLLRSTNFDLQTRE